MPGKALDVLFKAGKYSAYEKAKSRLSKALRSGIWIYGAGNFGRDMAKRLSRPGMKGRILGFIDANKAGQPIDGYPVVSPDVFLRKARTGPKPNVLIGVLSPQNNTAAIASLLSKQCTLFYPLAAFALLWTKASDNYFYLSDPKLIRKAEPKIREAYAIFADAKSRRLYLRHLELRFSGDIRELPNPEPDQYFPKGLGMAGRMGRFLDIGAYDGDTVEYVTSKNIKFGEYLAYEPDPENFKRLSKLVSDLHDPSIKAYPYAIGSKKCEIGISFNGSGSKVNSKAEYKVRCLPCDQLRIQPPTYLKMDVEGFEMDVLKGARRTIARSGPALAVCVYHKPADIWEIPIYLKSLGYNEQYLRLHAYNGLDLVLYAFKRP